MHKEYKARYGALKKELHSYEEENEALESQVAQLEESREQVEELTVQNRFLEDKVQKLCNLSLPKEGVNVMMTQEKQENQRNCEMLREENKDLKVENKRLDSQLQASSERIGDIWQKLDIANQQLSQKERELQDANELAQAQIDTERNLKREIISQGVRIEDLSAKSSQRLQRIRLLESQMSSEDVGLSNLSTGHNVLTVSVHSATLQAGLCSDNTKSFVLVDFHTYGSELSSIASGVSPKYDFTVTYDIEENPFFSHGLAKGDFVMIELYILQKEQSMLFASASVPTSALLHPSAAIHLSRLELTSPVGDGKIIGSLSMSLQLARPLSASCSSHEMIAATKEIDLGLSCRRRVVPDAISITIENVTLSSNHTVGDDRSFYVNYRFLSFGGVVTNLRNADATGVITFQDKSTFPLLSMNDGTVEPVIRALSSSTIHFTLFSGSSGCSGFHVLGEAQVPLSNIWDHSVVSSEIISLEAKVVGSEIISVEKVVGSIEISFDCTTDKAKPTHTCKSKDIGMSTCFRK